MKRSSWILAGLALLVLLGLGSFLWLPGRGLPRDLLGGVPGEAIGVLAVRVDRVLNSRAYEQLVVQRGQDAGLRRLQKVCGFHPLRGIEQALVFALPNASTGGKPRVAVLARGSIPHTNLIRCVSKLGRTGLDGLDHEEIEGIATLRSKNGSTRAAFIGSNGVVAGEAEAVRATIETLVGKRPGLDRDPALAAQFKQRSADNDFAVVARLDGQAQLLTSVLSRVGVPPETFATADLISLIGDVRFDNDLVRASAELRTRKPEQAEALVQTAEQARARIQAIPALSLTGFAKPLRELSLTRSEAEVRLRGNIQVRTLGAALEFLPALAALRRGMTLSPSAPVGDAGVPDAEDTDADADEATR